MNDGVMWVVEHWRSVDDYSPVYMIGEYAIYATESAARAFVESQPDTGDDYYEVKPSIVIGWTPQ